jgi:hypothetical protein
MAKGRHAMPANIAIARTGAGSAGWVLDDSWTVLTPLKKPF